MQDKLNSQIIALLKKSKTYITSKELSDRLGVSSKTIRRHVEQINDSQATEIILSKKGKGYLLDYEAYLTDKPELAKEKTDVEFRRESIMSFLLLKAPAKVSILSLLTKYYVSESVLQKDFLSIEKTLKKWNLSLIQQSQHVGIAGAEKTSEMR